jgi:head-tail adaptor
VTTQAGKLRWVFRVEDPERAVDPLGNSVTRWKPIGRVTLDVEPIGALERYELDRVGMVLTHKASGRWSPLLTSARRLVREDGVEQDNAASVFAIAGVWDVDGRRREMDLSLTQEPGGPANAG